MSGRNLPVLTQGYVFLHLSLLYIFEKPVVDAKRHIDYVPTLFAHTRKTAVVDERRQKEQQLKEGNW